MFKRSGTMQGRTLIKTYFAVAAKNGFTKCVKVLKEVALAVSTMFVSPVNSHNDYNNALQFIFMQM